MTRDRALELKKTYLDVFEERRTIPGDLVESFFTVYNTEISPGEFSARPCTCNSGQWIRMVEIMQEKVNAVLNG